MSLTIEQYQGIDRFMAEFNLCTLYKAYRWRNDAWETGFIDIRDLENKLSTTAQKGYIVEEHVKKVAKWGGLRDMRHLMCPERVEMLPYETHGSTACLVHSPSEAVCHLKTQITRGMGPTYLSKVLRFSQPEAFGAIDTQLVKVFGQEGTNWVSLRVSDYGSGPHIRDSQPGWPGEYDRWIEILRYIADKCNSNCLRCPHPEQLVQLGLRERGVWIVADVEMALFSHARMRSKPHASQQGATRPPC
jgi:hypothetical protein